MEYLISSPTRPISCNVLQIWYPFPKDAQNGQNGQKLSKMAKFFLPVRMMIFLEFLISSTTSCNVLTFANFFLRGGSETMFKIIFHRVSWSKWSGMTVSTSPRISLSNSLKSKQKSQFINCSSDQTNPDLFISKGLKIGCFHKNKQFFVSTI